MSKSTVTITGNLTASPEINQTKNGTDVANFTVASNRAKRVGDGWEDGDTTFIRVTCWDGAARNVMNTLRKGHAVVVFGRLETNRWKNKDGEDRSQIQINAEHVGPDLRYMEGRVHRVRRYDDDDYDNDGGNTRGGEGDNGAGGQGNPHEIRMKGMSGGNIDAGSGVTEGELATAGAGGDGDGGTPPF